MGTLTRSILSRLNFWALSFLLFVLFALLYVVLMRHNHRFDLTRERLFTLSPKTLEILKGLGPETITVKAFFKNDQPGKDELKDLLKTYAYHSSSLKYEFVDPDRNPGEAKRYGVDEYGTIIVEREDERERVDEITEEDLTNTLLKLVESHAKTLCFTKGHGEKILDSKKEKGYSHFRKRLEAENYRVKEVLLARDVIPSDTDLLVLAGLAADLMPEEITALKQYLDQGRKLLLLVDPSEIHFVHLEEWLKSYGVVLGQNVVVDKLSRIFGADYLIPVVTQYEDHKITEKLNVASFLPVARAVTAAKETPEDLKVSELAFTSQGSWAEQDWEEIKKGKVSFGGGDLPGPVSLAVVVERENTAMRLVVFGDSDFVDNAHFYLSGNKDLILNTIAWLAGEEKLVTIRPKERKSTPLLLSPHQQKLIFLVPVLALPMISLGSGLAVLLYRKRYT